MSHKFDVSQFQKLDNPQRTKALPAQEILNMIGIKETESVADLGCGIGYFSIPLALRAREVKAVDLSSEMLEELSRRIKESKTNNISLVQSQENHSDLESESVDLVFICTVVHEAADPVAFLQEARRILKSSGRIAIIDWIPFDRDFGPPPEHCLSSAYMEKTLEKLGFINITKKDLNRNFYLVTAEHS